MSTDHFILLRFVPKNAIQHLYQLLQETICWHGHLVMPLDEGRSGIQHMQFAKLNLNTCCELRCDIYGNGDVLTALPHF